MLRNAFLALLLLASSSLLAQDQDARVVTRIVTDTMPAWQTWKKAGYTMNFPSSWRMDSTAVGDTIVVFRGMTGGHSASAVVLIVRQQEGNKASKHDGRKSVQAEVVDKQVISSSGPDASGSYEMEYTGKMDGAMLHRLERVMIQDGLSYILTYTATPQAYEDQLFLAEAILNSFSPPAVGR